MRTSKNKIICRFREVRTACNNHKSVSHKSVNHKSVMEQRVEWIATQIKIIVHSFSVMCILFPHRRYHLPCERLHSIASCIFSSRHKLLQCSAARMMFFIGDHATDVTVSLTRLMICRLTLRFLIHDCACGFQTRVKIRAVGQTDHCRVTQHC
jgi:hypothetical protein